MAAGRPRLPRQQKILQGTFQKSRNPGNEADFPPVSALPPAPKTLNAYGKKLWKQLAPELIASGVMTAADLPAFALLCIRYGLGMELYDAITTGKDIDRKTGKTKTLRVPLSKYLAEKNSQTIPEYNAMRNEFAAAKQLMIEFGLTPASRNRFVVPDKNSGPNDSDRIMLKVLGDA
jgi:P27 family predicted phage terminase small subunit